MRKIFWLMIMALPLFFASCSDDDPEPRSEADIYGAWVGNDGNYYYFRYPNICYKLIPLSAEHATLDYDACYYEPGYNFILYVDIESQPDIYKVTDFTEKGMTWVWADNLRDDKYDGMSGSEILGQVIKEAQEGFKLDYSRTITFEKISFDEYKGIIDQYGYSYIIDEL